MTQVTLLKPLCACPQCGARAVVELTPEQRLAQPDDTTHVCHPALGGCNHGFTDRRTRGRERLCPSCGGTRLPPSIGGATRGSCHCPDHINPKKEDQMTKKKRDHGTATEPKPVTYTLPEPAAEAPKAEAKVAKAPKPIAYEPSGEIRAVKADSKLATLIDMLARPEGASLTELSEGLSRTGSKVDASGVRSWISYDLKRTGLGVQQVGDRLHLLGSPLPHKVAEPKPTPEPSTAAEPKLKVERGSAKIKKAAMTAKKSKAAAK